MFKLEFETANAAFGETDAERRAEVVRILRETADRIVRNHCLVGPCRDANGNTVGTYSLTREG